MLGMTKVANDLRSRDLPPHKGGGQGRGSGEGWERSFNQYFLSADDIQTLGCIYNLAACDVVSIG